MNLFDYLEKNLATFDEAPLCPPDSAVLSQFCMVRGEGVIPEARRPREQGLLAHPAIDALADRARAWLVRPARFAEFLQAERFDGLFCGLSPDAVKRELAALAASPRFRDLELRDYASAFDEEAHVQFAAVALVWRSPRGPEHDFSYVGFRGTDDSLTGWRENFDMVLDPPVPAQRMAADYLASVARHLPGKLYVGGHSKGGNLATYAALRAPERVRERIERVFDHDGPGFKPGFLGEEDFAPIMDRVHRTVPEESVVGMLMETPVPERVVRSTGHGIEQHSVFTWEIEGNDFVYAERLSSAAAFTHDLMSDWLETLSDDEAPRVVDALFRAIEASGARSAGDVFSSGAGGIALLTEAARNLDEESREALAPALAKLAASAARAGARGVAERLWGE